MMPSAIEGRVINSIDCGNHVAQLVEPVAAELRDPQATPLSVLEIFARDLDPWNPSPPPHWIRLD
jgi:flavin reductase (DIM6/NTAB) family NADH-FMN oxidoreductase RutF